MTRNPLVEGKKAPYIQCKQQKLRERKLGQSGKFKKNCHGHEVRELPLFG
jgi:hypothetical protein